MPLILDCTTFFQEADIWRLRYETLRPVVDAFVVVEANQTHAGYVKPLTFISPRGDPTVVHYTCDLPEPGAAGIPATRRREMTQRNAIADAIDAKWPTLPDDAIVLISDCDEIPRPEVIAALRHRGLADGEVVTFLQSLCYYNLNTRSPQPWPGTRAARWADVRALSPHVIRCGLGQPDSLYPKYFHFTAGYDLIPADQPGPRVWAGWHLSYFGGPEMVANKMRNFLHQELVTTDNTDPAIIAARMNAGEDVWGRPGGAHGITLGPAEDLPPPVAADPARWRAFFHADYQPAIEPWEDLT